MPVTTPEPRRPWPAALAARRLAARVLAAGLLLSLGLAWVQAGSNAARLKRALQADTEAAADALADRVLRYEYGLRGVRGAILAIGIESLRRPAFETYSASRDIDREFPGARGFGFIRRVPASHEALFVQHAAADAWPGFALRNLAPHGGERYVIQYIEPVLRNREAVGLDIASDPVRRAAAEGAGRSGLAAITAPITLVQASGKPQQAFLVLLPIYRPGLALDTEAARWAACLGWAYAPLVIDEVLGTTAPMDRRLQLTVDDTSQAPLRFHARAPARTAVPAAAPTARAERAVFGRRWTLAAQPSAAYVAALEMPSPTALFGAGALVSALLAALLAVFLQVRGSQRQVQQQQERLAALVKHSSDAIVTETPDGCITGFNRAAERLLGYTADEALGQDGARLLLPADRQPMAQALLERLRRGEAVEPFDQVLLCKDGQRVDMSVAISPILGPGGRLVGVGRTLRDISARSAAERAQQAFRLTLERQVEERTHELSTARRDLQAVLDAVPSMISYWDRGLVNRFANHACRTWFGVGAQALTGRHLRDLLGEGLFEQTRPPIEAAPRGEPQTFERTMVGPDGQGLRHVLAHYLPDTVDGAVQGFYVLVHDVTALKQSEQRLAEALRENDALLQTIRTHALFSVADAQGRIVDVNDGFCRISGYSAEELLGQNHRIVNSGLHAPEFWAAVWCTIASGRPWSGELCNRAKDGSLYWVNSIIAPVPGPDGKPWRYISIRQDITANKQGEQALRRAMQAAEAANAAKSAFLANMSHEIRTPLNAMIGLTYLLEHGRLEAEQRSYVGKIQLASRSLLGVVNDVLDLAKIEAGEANVELAPFDLQELLDSLAALYGEQAQARGLAFRLSQPSGLPRRVLGDAGRLRQVLSNLLANAVKFTERGCVSLMLRRLADDAESLSLRFEVHDTGIGIAADAQDSIFQPFAQADSSTTRRFGGTGLGLSIVRELTQLLGGKIALDSTPGRGSTFRLTLRLGLLADGGAESSPDRLALRLLIIHDDAQQAQALSAQAQALGWHADAVASPEAAAQSLRTRLGRGQPPEVLLAGGPLQGSAGRQALQEMGAALDGRRLPPVVLLGSGDDSCDEGGDDGPQVDDRLALPVTASSLFNVVNRALARRSGDPEKALRSTRLDGAGARWLPGVRVLVVDDSEINLEVAARILGREGAAVTACGSAAQALERLGEAQQGYDLVLMDVQMPGMDGYEATRRIRGELGLTRLPIVALTAGALVAERQQALDAGMNDFVSKPLDPDGLIRTLRRHVERARGRPLPVQLRESVPDAASTLAWPSIDGIDSADAASRLGQDVRLFRSLLQRLFVEFTDLMAEPPTLPRKQTECAALAARAHKLRGSAGVLGAGRVQELAAELEARLRRPAAGDGAAAALPEMMVALARALHRLQAASAPVLAQVWPEAPAPASEALTPQSRQDLLARLRSQDLSAQDRFKALAGGLQEALGETRYKALRRAIEDLRFDQATRLMQEEETT